MTRGSIPNQTSGGATISFATTSPTSSTLYDAQRPHAIPVHLQDLDFRAGPIPPQSNQPDAATEDLEPDDLIGLLQQFGCPFPVLIEKPIRETG